MLDQWIFMASSLEISCRWPLLICMDAMISVDVLACPGGPGVHGVQSCKQVGLQVGGTVLQAVQGSQVTGLAYTDDFDVCALCPRAYLGPTTRRLCERFARPPEELLRDPMEPFDLQSRISRAYDEWVSGIRSCGPLQPVWWDGSWSSRAS